MNLSWRRGEEGGQLELGSQQRLSQVRSQLVLD